MKYPRILSQIESMRWAITPQGLQSIWDIAAKHTVADYQVFHHAEEDEKQAIVADIGEPVKESIGAFVNGETGILLIDGPIIPRADSWDASSGLVGINNLTEAFKSFESNSKIKRVVGLFDSPGGDVTSIDEFSMLVARSEMETVAFVYGMAASAAYWIATGFDKVISSQTGIVGSIGTVAVFRNNKNDDKIEIVSDQSPDKRPDMTTKEGRANIQQVLNELTDVFVGAVATNMGVTEKKVLSDFGKGGELVAARALSVGMIDQITTLDALMSSFHQPNPAQGGAQRSVTMTLEEFLAANPAAAAQFERDKAEAQAKELADAKIKAKRDADIDSASKFLGTEYGQRIQTMAAGVIKGEVSMESLSMAVSMHDETSEKINSLEAKIESLETGATPSGENLTDLQKELVEDNQIRANLGMNPLGMEA